jgi:hypothetical protein
MESQVQCPNCGGYRVASWAVKEWPIVGSAYQGVLILMVDLCFIVFAFAFYNNRNPGGLFWFFLITSFLLFSYALLCFFTPAIGHTFECLLCGKRWYLRLGEPSPGATVRPDLIARGEQRLREEEEEPRRRDD